MSTQALRELRKRVEAGVFPGGQYGAARRAFPYNEIEANDHGRMAFAAYKGSLNAAMALHEAVLPGWVMESFNLHGEVAIKRRRPLDTAYGYADGNPARAWLLALLDALIQEAGE